MLEIKLQQHKTRRTVRLGEVANIIPGFAFKSKDFGETGIPVLKITEIQPPYVSFQKSDRVNIKNYDKNKLKKYFIHKGDYVVAMTGATIGKVGKVVDDVEALLNQRVAKIVAKDLVDPGFIYYAVDSSAFQGFINQIASGSSAQANISGDDIGEFEVNLPNLPTQKKIAGILGAYDAKIENNNLIIKNLEATAQAIFNEWFVKFNFPVELVKSEKLRVNNGGKVGYKDAGGKMVNSELGLIPEGWGVKSLDEVCDVSIGRTPPREEHHWFSRNKNDIKWISIKDLGSSGIFIFDTEEKLTKEAVKEFNITIIPKNTVIVSFKLTIGRVAITTDEMLSNEAIAHLKIKEENSISRQYLYLFMKGYDYYSLASTSSIANAVNSKTIRSIKLVVPSPTLMKSFNVVSEPIFNSLLSTQQENILLKASRDQLLKKLI